MQSGLIAVAKKSTRIAKSSFRQPRNYVGGSFLDGRKAGTGSFLEVEGAARKWVLPGGKGARKGSFLEEKGNKGILPERRSGKKEVLPGVAGQGGVHSWV